MLHLFFIQSGSLHCSLLKMTKSIHILQAAMVKKSLIQGGPWERTVEEKK